MRVVKPWAIKCVIDSGGRKRWFATRTVQKLSVGALHFPAVEQVTGSCDTRAEAVAALKQMKAMTWNGPTSLEID